MKGLIKAADGLTAVILTLAAGTMIGAIFLQVFFRFAVQSPLYWTEELSRYSFVYVVFIGFACAGKNHMHPGLSDSCFFSRDCGGWSFGSAGQSKAILSGAAYSYGSRVCCHTYRIWFAFCVLSGTFAQ